MKNEKLVNKLSIIGQKIGDNKYLQSISQGVMKVLPILIVGAFASLFAGLPIGAWQSVIKETGVLGCLNAIVNATTNLLGLFFTYSISKTLAEKLGIKAGIVPLLSLVVYIGLLPLSLTQEGASFLAFDYLGTKGMIVGILISLFVCHVYKFIIDKNIVIKMPQGTPQYVSDSFTSLIPAFVIVIATMCIRLLFAMTPYYDAFNCIYSLLQIPLTVLIGGSLFANIFIAFLTQVNWFLGIHPGYLTGAIAPILFALDGANQSAYAQGQGIPNTIGMAFNYITTVATVYAAIAVAVLLFAKSKQLKTVGKVAVAPAFFGISEPLVFGLPIVFNPILFIPWVITPIVNFVLGYFLTSIGLIAKCAGVTVFNIPMIFTGLMNGSVSIALMEVGLFILDILIFLPFIKAVDKKFLSQEKSVSEEICCN